jgi:phage shock protein B
MLEDILVPIVLFGTLFIGLPWLVLHYTTKWRSAGTLTTEDENLLDELYDTARRLEERLHTVERIVAADHPDWRPAVRADEAAEQLEYRPQLRKPERSN